jgi:hypothetical protein
MRRRKRTKGKEEETAYVDGSQSSYGPHCTKHDCVSVETPSLVDHRGEYDRENHREDGTGSVEEVGACKEQGEVSRRRQIEQTEEEEERRDLRTLENPSDLMMVEPQTLKPPTD